MILTLLFLASCSLFEPAIPDLAPASELEQACYGWPDREFNRKKHPSGQETRLATGDHAVDFTLQDRGGRSHRLASLLADGPVLLVSGSWTCNIFQKRRKEVEAIANAYEGKLQVVVVYTVEAHPEGEPSPYRGKPWPLEFSDRGQPDTYKERVANAKDLDLDDDVLVLVDALEPGNTNPYWCTYGSCPNCAFLVNQQGNIEAAHEWLHPPSMRGSIDALLDKSG